jgi:2'-5' RNA ligase
LGQLIVFCGWVVYNPGCVVKNRPSVGGIMPGKTGIRSFVAVELSDEVRQALAAVQRDLKVQAPPGAVRWTRPDSIHLTLQFLGDILPDQVEAIAGALRAACAGRAPFAFELAGAGVFPNLNRPRVVWVGVVEPSGALSALQQRVVQALAPLGFVPEERGFSPHLTIGRAARDAGSRDLAALGALVARAGIGSLGRVAVNAVNLMKSDLKPDGAVYTPLAVIPLPPGK